MAIGKVVITLMGPFNMVNVDHKVNRRLKYPRYRLGMFKGIMGPDV